MIIDFHSHIFPDKIAKSTIELLAVKSKNPPYTDGTAEGISASMTDAGVDISVILPVMTKVTQFDSVNRFASELCGRRGIISFGGIHPDCTSPEEKLDYIAELGLRGIKLHPDYQNVFIDDERYIRIISHAVGLGLCVSIHAGIDTAYPETVHCPPDRCAHMLELVHPELPEGERKIILAHSGGLGQTEEVLTHLCGKNVYFDLSYTLPNCTATAEETAKIIHAHGADKILFGTDSPWGDQKQGVLRLNELPITDREREMIKWENASRILGIGESELREKSVFGCKK